MPWALDLQEILQIAQEAVRQRGYVIYPDYEDALRQAIMDRRLRAVDAGWEHHNIREILLVNGYQWRRVHGQSRFYPVET
ncbi:unnamed protein product [marine sediment metagenome]|uniref:Uncharacterized protein n=1 Tax=marine sediment metagenome TaxID=412755 RepID=X1W2F2_9ZZZZ